MNIKNLIFYIILALCIYTIEVLVFGVWYSLYIKSTVRFQTFFRKMLRYYRYRIFRLHGERSAREPESTSFLLIYALGIPPLVSMIALLSDSWLIRFVFIFAGISIVANSLFRDEKVLTKVRINGWIRFLYSPECMAALSDSGKNAKAEVCKEKRKTTRKKMTDEEDGDKEKEARKQESFNNCLSKEEGAYQNQEAPLSKGERRKEFILTILLLLVIFALCALLIAGLVLKFGEVMSGSSTSFLKLFSEEKYNTATYILLAAFFILALIYLFNDKDFRRTEKEKAVEYFHEKKRKAVNALGFGAGIFIDPAFSEWEKTVIHICGTMNIRQVAVVSEAYVNGAFSGRIAMTAADPEGIPTIVLSTKEIRELRFQYSSKVVHDMVCFLLGHELTHVRYRDYNKKRTKLKMLAALLVYLGMSVVWMCVVALLPESMFSIGSILLIALLFLAIIFRRNVIDETYWNYVSEYRADRKSAEINETAIETVEELLKLKIDAEEEEGTTKYGKRKKTHPGATHRIRELRRGKNWGVSEYVRYAIRVEW